MSGRENIDFIREGPRNVTGWCDAIVERLQPGEMRQLLAEPDATVDGISWMTEFEVLRTISTGVDLLLEQQLHSLMFQMRSVALPNSGLDDERRPIAEAMLRYDPIVDLTTYFAEVYSDKDTVVHELESIRSRWQQWTEAMNDSVAGIEDKQIVLGRTADLAIHAHRGVRDLMVGEGKLLRDEQQLVLVEGLLHQKNDLQHIAQLLRARSTQIRPSEHGSINDRWYIRRNREERPLVSCHPE